jgi:aryl-alcohol dehydrogenase-like predicted oxidoreductase
MGMGCAAIGGPFLNQDGGINAYGTVNDEESIRAMQLGLEMGVTLFDTANVYGCGHSETVLGKALKGQIDDVIIATKFGNKWDLNSSNPLIPCQATGIDISPQGIRKACDESLQRLKRNYIDVYQLHLGYLNTEYVPGILLTLEELVDEGKIRYYGWSTNIPENARLFAEGKHCTTTQFRHNLISRNSTMLEFLDDYSIAGLIKGPLGYGLLTGKYRKDSQVSADHVWYGTKFNEGEVGEVLDTIDAVREILTDDGRTLAQAALGWIWAQHDLLIPIPGFKRANQAQENIEAMEFGPFSKRKIKEIERLLSEGKEVSKGK